VQTIWARLGRRVVSNLTTVSTPVGDFTTLILGYYFAERVANEAPSDSDLGSSSGGSSSLDYERTSTFATVIRFSLKRWGRSLSRRLSTAERKFYAAHLLFGGPQERTTRGQAPTGQALHISDSFAPYFISDVHSTAGVNGAQNFGDALPLLCPNHN
jgi:hypothetical protein